MMGAALLELENALRSGKEKVTDEEANVIFRCKSNARNGFFTGALIGGGLTWAASHWARTSRVGRVARIYLSGGGAAIFAFWKFEKSLDSSVDQILSRDGSRLQKELANILVQKFEHDPWTMQLMYKHFYLEHVFNDSNMDKATSRWRFRNFFSDNDDTSGQTAQDSESDDSSSNNINIKTAPLPSRRVPGNIGKPLEPPMEDLLDTILGPSAKVDEIHHASSMSSREFTRHQRRSHRRRRRLHEEMKNAEEHQA